MSATGMQQIAGVTGKNAMPTGIKEVTPKKVHTVEGRLNGIKYKGPQVDLKEGDNPETIFLMNQQMHVATLNLEDEKELEEYEGICQTIAMGDGALSHEDIRYNKQDKTWSVFIRWQEMWYTLREKK